MTFFATTPELPVGTLVGSQTGDVYTWTLNSEEGDAGTYAISAYCVDQAGNASAVSTFNLVISAA